MSPTLPPSFPGFLLLNRKLCGMEYSFGQLGTALSAVSPLSCVPPAWLLLGCGREITASQNGSGWRGPQCSSAATSLRKQGHPRACGIGLIQTVPEYLQWERLHNLPAKSVPVPSHYHSKKVLPHIPVELAVCQFLSFAPCPIVWQHQEELEAV